MNQDVSHFLNLLYEMTIRELRVRYKNTTLGFLWVLIYPIIQAAIIGYVFQFLFKNIDKNYPYYLFLNLLVWNFFSSSLDNATSSIIKSRSIIKKAKFPYMVIPLSIILCNGIHFLLPLSLFIVFIYLFHIAKAFNILLVLLGCLLLLVFTSGFSLITTALNVKSRDIGFITRAFLMIWFYATPVVYSLSNIPSNIKYLWNFNPLTEIIIFFQKSFFRTEISAMFIISNSLLIIITIFLGIFIFLKRQDYFDDYV